MTEPLWLVLSGVVGAIVGSFLNVCIYRLPLDRSVVWPGSSCDVCDRPLRWFENVPVVSFVMLRGRCRTCGTRLSLRHPLVEAVTALLFVAACWQWGLSPLLVQRLVLACGLLVLFFIDLDHHWLPDAITLPGIGLGLLASLGAWLGLVPGAPSLGDALLGVAIGGGSLWGVRGAYYLWRREEGLGLGDVKLLAAIGAFLGWQLTLLTLVLASFAGALVGGLLLLTQRGDMKTALPFGTVLAVGAWTAVTVGMPLLAWYLALWPPV